MTTIFAIAFGVLFVAGVCAWLIYRPLHSARLLEQRCAEELRHLKSLLTDRHLILSHLYDVLPDRSDLPFDRRRLKRQLTQAEKGLRKVDPDSPSLASLRETEDLEQRLMMMLQDLTIAIKSSEPVSRTQTVSGCLDGLEKTSMAILDAASTYNAAAITYATFLDSSRIARRRFCCNYEAIELDLQCSGISSSTDSGISGDRVAS